MGCLRYSIDPNLGTRVPYVPHFYLAEPNANEQMFYEFAFEYLQKYYLLDLKTSCLAIC